MSADLTLKLELEGYALLRLQELQRVTGADSFQEVIRGALALLDLAAAHQMSGGAMLLRYADGSVLEFDLIRDVVKKETT